MLKLKPRHTDGKLSVDKNQTGCMKNEIKLRPSCIDSEDFSYMEVLGYIIISATQFKRWDNYSSWLLTKNLCNALQLCLNIT